MSAEVKVINKTGVEVLKEISACPSKLISVEVSADVDTLKFCMKYVGVGRAEYVFLLFKYEDLKTGRV